MKETIHDLNYCIARSYIGLETIIKYRHCALGFCLFVISSLIIGLSFNPASGIVAKNVFANFVVNENEERERKSRSPPIDPICACQQKKKRRQILTKLCAKLRAGSVNLRKKALT